MIKEFMSKQFLLFLLMGGISAGVSFITRILYNDWFNFSMAVFLAYITGMITLYLLAKIFVFKQSTQKSGHSIFYFCLVNLVGVGQTLVVSMGMAYYILPMMGLTEFILEIAHMLGIAAPAFTSYLGHKYWSFRGEKE